jgi:hypothetical protein
MNLVQIKGQEIVFREECVYVPVPVASASASNPTNDPVIEQVPIEAHGEP